jgi:protein gp37
MGRTTGISWTDATWNPIRGCSRVSEGCRNCYAEAIAYRFSGPGQPYEGLVQRELRTSPVPERLPLWNGQIKFVEEHVLDPLGWKKPRRIFVNSMSDLFHPNVSDQWIAWIVAVMVRAHWHTYQVLTKRPERMACLLASEDFWRLVDFEVQRCEGGDFLYTPPLAHIHWGVSVEDQETADQRLPLLQATPAAVRFVSIEPLLGAVGLRRYIWPVCWHWDSKYRTPELAIAAGAYAEQKPQALVSAQAVFLDWVIVGGESGPGARPMHPDWVRSLRDECVTAGVPFFFKQWGEWSQYYDTALDPDLRNVPKHTPNRERVVNLAGGHGFHGERVVFMRRVGTKAAGCLLDGVEHHQFPQVQDNRLQDNRLLVEEGA